MPHSPGPTVLARLKQDPARRHIPVLMISALDETASVVRSIELGAEDYLPKPCDAVLLRARIGACLEKKRLRDQEAQHAVELAQWNRTLEQRVVEHLLAREMHHHLVRFVEALRDKENAEEIVDILRRVRGIVDVGVRQRGLCVRRDRQAKSGRNHKCKQLAHCRSFP
jgi:response regulator RpfG family c-di-GMP phosphodiesterase